MSPTPITTAPSLPHGMVVGIQLGMGVVLEGARNLPTGTISRTAAEKLAEATNLLEALDVWVKHAESITLKHINPATLLGGGKVQQLAQLVQQHGIEVVMVDAPLSPRQQAKLEEIWQTKVLDRTGVILQIFAARARTSSGKLQVELAQLQYQQSRLVRLWSHLERQRGGMGKTGGPGERQLELDKRLIKEQLSRVRRQLKDVEQNRGLQRMARAKAQLPTVALVGYTNAGKSTLFNRLVDAGTLMADALFATLDPLMRRLKLPGGMEVVLVDTVGFIADLPHELVEAFKATLEEVVLADVLLHVQDASSAERQAQAADVQAVLADLGAGHKRTLVVANKADKAEHFIPHPQEYLVSAITGQGVPQLLQGIETLLKSNWITKEVQVPAADGRRLAWLHAHGEVLSQQLVAEQWHLKVKLRATDIGLWEKMA